jgi:hypothetical protein
MHDLSHRVVNYNLFNKLCNQKKPPLKILSKKAWQFVVNPLAAQDLGWDNISIRC